MNYKEVENNIKDIIYRKMNVSPDIMTISTSDTLSQIGLDSLSTMEFLIQLEEEYSIEWNDETINEVNSINDITEYILKANNAA